MKRLFFEPIKVFWSIAAQKNKTKQMLIFGILWNTLKDGLCYLGNGSVSLKVFLLNMYEVQIQSGKAYTSFNLFRILNIFL